ncbi:hypothetical protein BUALT_Bualt10G0112200 [Buddleja alternifolia]|uniref:Uncharacterized protein n=1 Tax=Buddleja alternifolia TaxID=168488 RepID=A0AAV6X8T2_9LAMI|nr:hypothetical protein BUALT_Bualt10G0112200 [Buddleja alternifolia]
MAYISDIKLIRTDTTLDLSQKAEKGMLNSIVDLSIYTCSVLVLSFAFDVGLKFWFRLECYAKAMLEKPQQQATVMGSPPIKINLISCEPLAHISDIKLIRTDTTLDLSQKAEKGMLCSVLDFSIYRHSFLLLSFAFDVGIKFGRLLSA